VRLEAFAFQPLGLFAQIENSLRCAWVVPIFTSREC